MKEIEIAAEFSRMKVQGYTDKLQNAINPIHLEDLPFLVYSMKTITKTLEEEMDAKQKVVAEELGLFLGVEKKVINHAAAMTEFFNRGGNK